jgi:sialic acid synthase
MHDSIRTPKIVAEVCCNHQGKMNLALKMINVAKICGVDYVKFQKRNPIKAVPEHMHNKAHPCPMHSFGETYLQHRNNLEFSLEQHKVFMNKCNEIGIGYSSSVWDEDSANDIISLNPDFIKIPSAMNLNYQLLNQVYEKYDGDVHVSLGMITKAEREDLFRYLEDKKERTVVYWTTSAYPVKFEELFLLEIIELKKMFPRVGYSGHHLGIAVDVAAFTLGADWIERHFTLDRTSKGTDNAASLEPVGLQKVGRDIRAVSKSLQYKGLNITSDEASNRFKLQKKTKNKS